MFQACGIKLAPRDVATKIVENVPSNDVIDKLEVAGPGFVNIFIKKSFIQEPFNIHLFSLIIFKFFHVASRITLLFLKTFFQHLHDIFVHLQPFV